MNSDSKEVNRGRRNKGLFREHQNGLAFAGLFFCFNLFFLSANLFIYLDFNIYIQKGLIRRFHQGPKGGAGEGEGYEGRGRGKFVLSTLASRST